MNQLHIGRGTSRGAMTIFPVWAEQAGFSRYTTSANALEVSEVDDGPDVGRLMVGNPGDRPALVLEGQLFEGGWQHRMATRSIMIGIHQRIPVDVACVEQGRWSGQTRQRTRGRRATPYIREAVRSSGDVQGEVWSRVARHTAGTDNATGSFVRRLDAAAADLDAWADARPLAGQVGVVIGIGGQPYVAEVFDSPQTLRRQFRAIVEAAALDALHAPEITTPSRRAWRFIERCDQAERSRSHPAGVGEEFNGRSPYVDTSSLRWDGHDVHTQMSNVRHPMLAAH